MYSLDIGTDARCAHTQCIEAGCVSFAAMPLHGDEGLVGVLGAGDRQAREFSRQEALLEILSGHIAVALTNEVRELPDSEAWKNS